MCGRYALYGPVSRLRETFDAVPEGFELAKFAQRAKNVKLAFGI